MTEKVRDSSLTSYRFENNLIYVKKIYLFKKKMTEPLRQSRMYANDKTY